MGRVNLTEVQWKVLSELSAHDGQFRRGYGRSAHALMRRGLAKRKFVSDDGMNVVAKFAISPAGRALLAQEKQDQDESPNDQGEDHLGWKP